MTGMNTIRLNSATMVEAMQQYFDKEFTKKVIVKSVEENKGSYATTYSVLFEGDTEVNAVNEVNEKGA